MEENQPRPPEATGRVPTFLVIGGQRCGSSWIHKCLAEHPDVFVATPKELHYFNRNFDRGRAWYLQNFSDADSFTAAGEVTPDYIADGQTPERVLELNPEMRLVAVLREPIERAHSLYRLKMGTTLDYPTFQDAIDHHPEMLEHGLYAQHLRNWHACFDPDQLLILLYDDLIRSDAQTICKIYRHIGVGDGYIPSWIGKTDNAAVMPVLRKHLTHLGLESLVKRVGRSSLGNLIRRRARAKKIYRDPLAGISPDTLNSLRAYYSGPNDELRHLIGRDLTNWS